MSNKKYLPNKTLKSIQNRFLFPSFCPRNPINMFGEERTYYSTTFIYCTRQYFSIPPKTIHSFPWATQKPSCHPRKPSPVPSARHCAIRRTLYTASFYLFRMEYRPSYLFCPYTFHTFIQSKNKRYV